MIGWIKRLFTRPKVERPSGVFVTMGWDFEPITTAGLNLKLCFMVNRVYLVILILPRSIGRRSFSSGTR